MTKEHENKFSLSQAKLEKTKPKEHSKETKQKAHSKETKADPKDLKIAELTDTLQRLQAEFENYKKYVEKSKAEFLKYAQSDIIDKLLPILDSFEMALKHTTDKEKLIKGIELIYSQLYSLLEKQGLKKIQAKGKLDTHLHEVLLKEESDKEEDTILEELQAGYMLGDKILRHTKVKVSKLLNPKDSKGLEKPGVFQKKK